MHHYDREMKNQSLEYHYPIFLSKRKNLTQPSAEKCMLTILWDYRGNICKEYIIKGTKINSKTQVRTTERPKT
jgi:hypothetical protein